MLEVVAKELEEKKLEKENNSITHLRALVRFSEQVEKYQRLVAESLVRMWLAQEIYNKYNTVCYQGEIISEYKNYGIVFGFLFHDIIIQCETPIELDDEYTPILPHDLDSTGYYEMLQFSDEPPMTLEQAILFVHEYQ